MNYTKPEVNTLGDASTVIEAYNPFKPVGTPTERLSKLIQPAYDLDE